MKKVTTLTSAALMAGFSSIAFSADPPAAPVNYDNGPQSPLVANTDLSDAERGAYALYEGVLQIAEASIHASSCAAVKGSSNITAFSDGSLTNGDQNFVTVTSFGGTYRLEASLNAKVAGRGQKVDVAQVGFGLFGGTFVANYAGTFTFNQANNMMTGQNANVQVVGINGVFDAYQIDVIKDFNRGALSSTITIWVDPTNPENTSPVFVPGFIEKKIVNSDYYSIFDWGLQALNKLNYPADKYWQRSKSRRDNGTVGRTVFVKDRLVGATSCRITIDTNGFNNQSFFSQKGTVTIEEVTPATPVTAFSEAPF